MSGDDIIQVDELEGTPVTLLQDHVERVQEDNLRLELLLEEACEYLDQLVSVDDEEEAEDIIFNVKKFLEARTS